MTCQECGKRPATAIYAEIVDNNKTVFHLCQECVARKKGLETLSSISFSIGNLLAKWLRSEHSLMKTVDLKCEQCGLSYADFREYMKLGCSGCYEAFSDELDGLLQRIQGDNRHKGKHKGAVIGAAMVPVMSLLALPPKENAVPDAVPDLERKLKIAVEQEKFEEAAKLRDEIARLNAKEKNGRE